MILPYVPVDGEDEIRSALARVLPLHTADGPGADVARQWFYETVVRLHRVGEHAGYTGLKPAGLDHPDGGKADARIGGGLPMSVAERA